MALPSTISHSFLPLLLLLVLCEATGRGRLKAAETFTAQPWTAEGHARWRPLPTPTGTGTGFRRLAPDTTGVRFTNTLSELQGATNRVLWNGSGVATGDVNGDGLPDIYLCRLNGTNSLYLNQGGFRFRDATAAAGLLRPSRFDRGAVLADLTGDGHLDLLIATTGHGVECWINQGTGRFRDVTSAVGTRSRLGASTLALADVNGDGFLDLYVCHYRVEDIKDRGRVILPTHNGIPTVPPDYADQLVIRDGQLLQYGEPDTLYLNNGRNGFKPVPWTDGAFLDEQGQPLASPPRDWGLSATFRDFNGDSFPDLYVCNDFWTPDRFWLGDGHGGFRACPPLSLRKMSGSSMGIDVADLDRDGTMDFLVVEMLGRDTATRKRQLMPTTPDPSPIGVLTNRPQVLRNTLFRNRGDGTFAELAHAAGLTASDWSWSPVFLDVDLDGFEDVLISAGHIHDLLDADAQNALRTLRNPSDRVASNRRFTPLHQPIVAFRNHGNWQFSDVTPLWGTDHPGIHHALATADFDQDGDLDLVVNTLNSPAELYRNDTAAPRLAVRLRGRHPNVQGIGARVTLRGGSVPQQTQEVVAGGRYMAGSDPQLTFATGTTTAGMTLEVAWRSGQHSSIPAIAPNRLYEIAEPTPTLAPTNIPPTRPLTPPTPPAPQPLFRDVSESLNHTHHDEPTDEFTDQPLLHRSVSQTGPGLAWFDIDGNEHEDLIIGAGRGSRIAVFLNPGKGPLVAFTNTTPLPTDPPPLDITHVLGWHSAPNTPTLLVNSVHGPTHRLVNGIPTSGAGRGPLALADIQGDGTLELFAGGAPTPRRYPHATRSTLNRRKRDTWTPDTTNHAVLSEVGLVQGARWTDLDNDGFPELALACEWGPLRLFRNQRGRLEPWDPPVTLPTPDSPSSNASPHPAVSLSSLTGWWSGITAGDFNGDGRLDLAAANWGLNSPYRASTDHPLVFEFGHLRGHVGIDLIETEWDPTRRFRTPTRRMGELTVALPSLPARFPSHEAYSLAPISEVLGDATNLVHQVSATTLQTLVLINQGDRFESIPLPPEAQLAPAFGLGVADADGDGHEDLFLAQNFFATRPEIGRLDAGRGLWLLGLGNGRFRALSPRDAGIAVDGQGRAAAMADFNGDGRIDLAVSQHGAATRLFENIGAHPGLRVRLIGPPGNPTGIGAILRLAFGTTLGPAREIHAGAGYASQDGAIQVLATPVAPDRLHIMWPGGLTHTVPIPPATHTLTVRHPNLATATRAPSAD